MSELSVQIPIFIINLERSPDRRVHIDQQFRGLGLSYEFFNAVDGKKDHPLFSHYDAKKRLYCKGCQLSPGEVACFASHYLLWQRCIELQKPIVILEDDVVVAPEFAQVIKELPLVIDQFSYVRLFGLADDSYWAVRSYPFGQAVKYPKDPAGTQGYVISPQAAQKLILHAERWYLPVDIYLGRFWQHQVESIGLLPYRLKHSVLESTLSGWQGKIPLPLWFKLRRELLEASDTLRRYWHNAKFLICHFGFKAFCGKKQ